MKRHAFLFTALLATLLSTCVGLAKDKRSRWVELFDGKTLKGWQRLSGKPILGWTAENGVLTYKVPKGQRGGSLYTEKEYSNFILELEYKIVEGGNSGIKYRMTYYDKSYLGPEYQILGDSKKPRSGKSMGATGSLYVLSPVDLSTRKINPEGQWNSVKIVADGKRIEHYLNGKLTVKVDLASEEFANAVKKSKFKKWPDYAQNKAGRIMLQDHGSEISFRKIRIKELP